MAQHGLTHQQRKELMEKGPFNLVFHGLKADWIEEEMADDEEFKREIRKGGCVLLSLRACQQLPSEAMKKWQIL